MWPLISLFCDSHIISYHVCLDLYMGQEPAVRKVEAAILVKKHEGEMKASPVIGWQRKLHENGIYRKKEVFVECEKSILTHGYKYFSVLFFFSHKSS